VDWGPHLTQNDVVNSNVLLRLEAEGTPDVSQRRILKEVDICITSKLYDRPCLAKYVKINGLKWQGHTNGQYS
jgi:hypothetical protein